MDKPTEIIVASVRDDEYGNRWVTPQGGGEEIKIGEKRHQLHELFQQGNKVALQWETYTNKEKHKTYTYVSDAALVSGETKKKEDEPPQPPDARTDDIHNQVAYKIAGGIFAAYVQAGSFLKATPTDIAIKIGLMAKEIKACMEMKIEEIEE